MSVIRIAVNLLFVLLIVVYGGLSFAEDKSKYRYPDLDTPFIAEFRNLYEKNDKNNFNIAANIALACPFNIKVPEERKWDIECTEQDVQNMEKLAALGDMFSVALVGFMWSGEWRKRAIEKEEPLNLFAHAAYLLDKKEISEDTFISMMKKTGYFGYKRLAYYYQRSGRIKELCKNEREAYDKYGFEYVAPYFVSAVYGRSKPFFSECGIFDKSKSKKKLLQEIGTEEAKFTNAARLLYGKKFEGAAKIFKELATSKDNIMAVNANYCLGLMTYTGKGVEEDKKKGLEIVNDSYDKGIFQASTLIKKRRMKVDTVITYSDGNFCNVLIKDMITGGHHE